MTVVDLPTAAMSIAKARDHARKMVAEYLNALLSMTAEQRALLGDFQHQDRFLGVLLQLANVPDNDPELFSELIGRAENLRDEMGDCNPPARPKPTLVQ